MENHLISIQQCEQLKKHAITLGASDCAVVDSKNILVKDELAALCNGEYTCPNYGLAASCPPHVEGPDQFRKWQAESHCSLVVKIELPTSVMFSDGRKDVMQLLHQIVAAVEHKAVKTGFKKSKAFAGGSCKDLFCPDQADCVVLTENKVCPHKDLVRPSMSGFGVDVTKLMESCGWSGRKAEKTDAADKQSASWIAGLILLA